MQQPLTKAYGIEHTRPIVARGRHLSEAANELQQLAGEIRAKHEASARAQAQLRAQREPAAVQPRPEGRARYRPTCSLCGEESIAFTCAGCNEAYERMGL